MGVGVTHFMSSIIVIQGRNRQSSFFRTVLFRAESSSVDLSLMSGYLSRIRSALGTFSMFSTLSLRSIESDLELIERLIFATVEQQKVDMISAM